MRRTLFSIIAVLDIASCLAACKKTSNPKPEARDGSADKKPLLLGIGGSITHNGLPSTTYDAQKIDLEGSMAFALTKPLGGTDLDPAFPALDPTLINYAISCAVPRYAVKRTGSDGYVNNNRLLQYTNGWITSKLDPSAREDLHTCIATRLNPSGDNVDIWMAGPRVINDSSVKDVELTFQVEEAYWATIKEPSAPATSVGSINVWPSPDLKILCNGDGTSTFYTAVSDRVCGRGKTCGVIERTDMGKCVGGVGNVHCLRDPLKTSPVDQPVIQTRMKCTDWCTFYPKCKIPSQCSGSIPLCPAVP
jgi:hypothetical protein